MMKKPLPRSSGIGRAAKRERGSARRRRRGPATEAAAYPTRSFSSPTGGSATHRPASRPRPASYTSNEAPTLATKPIPWANPLHPFRPGISATMWSAESVLTAATRCALMQEEGQAP